MVEEVAVVLLVFEVVGVDVVVVGQTDDVLVEQAIVVVGLGLAQLNSVYNSEGSVVVNVY